MGIRLVRPQDECNHYYRRDNETGVWSCACGASFKNKRPESESRSG